MKTKKLIVCILFLSLFTSCIEHQDCDRPVECNLSPLDKLFISGFQMELVQIYIMPGRSSIPIFDTPVDSLFRGNISMVNLLNYQTTEFIGRHILYGLVPGEIWDISEMSYIYHIIRWEQGFGSSYRIVEMVSTTPVTNIRITNPFTERELLTHIRIGNIYNHRGRDNHIMNIFYISTQANVVDGEIVSIEQERHHTNLWLTVLTELGNGLFNGNYIYFDTNAQVQMSQRVTAPLTSDQVRIQIELGNYELYLWNGIVTFRIGYNLYVPRFNGFVYVGTVNQVGMIHGFYSFYYRLKFRVLN